MNPAVGFALKVFAVSGVMAMAIWVYQQPASPEPRPKGTNMEWKSLTPEEERVIVNKGTERPFTGKFYKHHDDGTYTCKRCGAPLFASDAKFESGCGWPSFDDAIEGSVKEVPDADGMRTEIVCAKCGAHLGHVFRGEQFTPKNTRHCVNSVSLEFISEEEQQAMNEPAQPSTETAYFAGGCFWGVEYYMEQIPGVISVTSGYMGGDTDNPSYKQVCYEDTGHAEVVEVVFDPSKTSYETVAKMFFEIHDPTQKDRQGPDIGEQYRSAVFYKSPEQRQIALQLIGELKGKGLRVVTEVEPAGEFWKAEEYHQDYYKRTGKTPYCHSRVFRFR